jgi:hypothetical protein
MNKIEEQAPLYIECDCHTHILKIEEINFHDGWWELYIEPFYMSGHNGENLGFWGRIKTASKILFKGRATVGKDVVIMNPDTAQLVVNFFNNFIEKCDPEQKNRPL